MLDYARYVWTNIPGPKKSVVVMSLVVGFANGGMLSAINSAISARVDGTFDWTQPALFVASVIAFFVGGYFAMYRATDMAEGFVELLRKQVVNRVTATSLRAVEDYGRGETYVHLTRDTGNVGMASVRLVKAFQAAIVVVFCLSYLAWLSPLVFGVTLVLVVVGIVLFDWQERRAKAYLERARTNEAKLFSGISDLLDGFKEVKLNSAVGEDLRTTLNTHSALARVDFVRAEFLFYSTSIVSKFMLFALLGVIAFLPVEWIGVTSGLAFQILAVLLYLVPPLEQLVDMVGPYMRAQVSLNNLRKLEAAMDREEAGRDSDFRFEEPLRLDAVELDYKSEDNATTFTLGPIDMTVNPGEIVFLVGGNGSGKTSLMKVLTGLYPPTRGRILLGDTLLTPQTIGGWRDLIASVFHDFHLFDQAYGIDPDRARKLLEEEIVRVRLHDKVSLTEDGAFSTTRLSTGQRKRLALVLARAQRRPVLVLDEFGAEQDPEFRAFFYTEYLDALRAQGVTVIAVTHDDRYFGTCDRLVKLDLGRVVYDGPPTADSAPMQLSRSMAGQ
ncbi:hypothetical protein ATO6_06190 [Oceanicola sp. 22II-s10i]|uniref:cyclic peptide export ABC transporter n=1 Tax=Oceanicola sp. 22II-s10i TaxID=1317116 RepID=UPI000B52830F|nr:cyclic peptide export ABC transporter [Oceanicola sp. 22II-s10i]OWU86402.1 hypothetical protein ATO6_06190 [Oceanicola sp. 22II-s10i]